MKPPTAGEELTRIISEKEAEIMQERVVLNKQFQLLYQHLQPSTFIKNKLKDIITDTELVTDLKRATIGIVTTVATGMMLQATLHKPVKRGIGLLSSLAIRFVTKRFLEDKNRQNNAHDTAAADHE